MNNALGPVQKRVLQQIKEFYRSNKDKPITVVDMVGFTEMPYTTLEKAMNNLARKGMLRRISPRRGYTLLC